VEDKLDVTDYHTETLAVLLLNSLRFTLPIADIEWTVWYWDDLALVILGVIEKFIRD